MEKEDKEIPQRVDSRGDTLVKSRGPDKTNQGSSLSLGKLETKERQLEKIREKQMLLESLRQTQFLPHILIEIFVKGSLQTWEQEGLRGQLRVVHKERMFYVGVSFKGIYSMMEEKVAAQVGDG